MAELRVYVHLAQRVNSRVAEQCRRHGVNGDDPVLLVLATRHGPSRLAECVAKVGMRPMTVNKNGSIDGIVEVRAEYLTARPKQHPEQLLATAGTGNPPPLNSAGVREHMWAQLSHSTPESP